MIQDLQEVLLDEGAIAARVAALGAEISADYQEKEILMIGILRGAVIFMSDLARTITIPVTLDFMAVSSYGLASKSSGVVRIMKDLEETVEGKHLLIVEDIIDTGLTMKYLLENLWTRQPASVKICTLLNKPSRRKALVPLDYHGFDIPDEFVVGYGLDYAGKYRNLPFIGVLKPSVYES
jgi:hypoxanthine phosphoribosyltransferase